MLSQKEMYGIFLELENVDGSSKPTDEVSESLRFQLSLDTPCRLEWLWMF